VNARDLVILTAGYPFDHYEPYLDLEVEVLAERFRHVHVLPSETGTRKRPVPANVSVTELNWLGQWSREEKLRALASPEALSVLFETIRYPANWRRYWPNRRFYLDILAMNVLRSGVLRRFIEQTGLQEPVFYDYWFENNTVALAILRRAGVTPTAGCRAHNFDIYDERWERGPVPFREFKAKELDAIFAVSEHGARYLRVRVPASSAKIEVFRLGVEPQRTDGGPPPKIPLIVSCAWLEPRKRVALIPEVLARVGVPLHWIHFGGGDEWASVEAAAATLPETVSWELRGSVDHDEILAFYHENHVGLFLSLSVSEGIPVSMMEAQSFGIPIAATAVNGVPEIVTERTGVGLDRDASLDEIAQAVRASLQPDRFDRHEVASFFEDRFDARKNYGALADRLIALRAS
jgi:glycosyltransferase involved in cell wall biosynthesis